MSRDLAKMIPGAIIYIVLCLAMISYFGYLSNAERDARNGETITTPNPKE